MPEHGHTPRLLVATIAATAVAVGGVVLLATGEWWALGVALGVHFVATVGLLVYFARSLEGGDKPDPYTEAKLEQERRPREPDVRRRHRDRELIT